MEIEDIATKEVKVKDDWLAIDGEDTFFNEKSAQDFAEHYAKLEGYKIVREGDKTDGNT